MPPAAVRLESVPARRVRVELQQQFEQFIEQQLEFVVEQQQLQLQQLVQLQLQLLVQLLEQLGRRLRLRPQPALS